MAFLGTLIAGGTCVPLHTKMPPNKVSSAIEVSGVQTVITDASDFRPGGVTQEDDKIRDGVEVKLRSFGQWSTNDRPNFRGEVLVRSANIRAGYILQGGDSYDGFQLDTDGFYGTGDIGEMYADDRLKIIGRKSSAFMLSNGEWVSPEELETVL